MVCGASLLLLPLSAFFSAMCLSVGVYARSSKEGQYYLMPLFLLTMPLVFLTLAPGVELNHFYSMVPVTGVALLLQSLIKSGGSAGTQWMYFVPVLAPMVIYSWLAARAGRSAQFQARRSAVPRGRAPRHRPVAAAAAARKGNCCRAPGRPSSCFRRVMVGLRGPSCGQRPRSRADRWRANRRQPRSLVGLTVPLFMRAATDDPAAVGIGARLPPWWAVRSVGPAADIFALGAILYHGLTGQAPFEAPTMFDTLCRLNAADPVRPSSINAKAPDALQRIALKCLEKQPEHRYRSASALADALDAFCYDKPLPRDTPSYSRFYLFLRQCERHKILTGMVLFVLGAARCGGWPLSIRLVAAVAPGQCRGTTGGGSRSPSRRGATEHGCSGSGTRGRGISCQQLLVPVSTRPSFPVQKPRGSQGRLGRRLFLSLTRPSWTTAQTLSGCAFIVCPDISRSTGGTYWKRNFRSSFSTEQISSVSASSRLAAAPGRLADVQ